MAQIQQIALANHLTKRYRYLATVGLQKVGPSILPEQPSAVSLISRQRGTDHDCSTTGGNRSERNCSCRRRCRRSKCRARFNGTSNVCRSRRNVRGRRVHSRQRWGIDNHADSRAFGASERDQSLNADGNGPDNHHDVPRQRPRIAHWDHLNRWRHYVRQPWWSRGCRRAWWRGAVRHPVEAPLRLAAPGGHLQLR